MLSNLVVLSYKKRVCNNSNLAQTEISRTMQWSRDRFLTKWNVYIFLDVWGCLGHRLGHCLGHCLGLWCENFPTLTFTFDFVETFLADVSKKWHWLIDWYVRFGKCSRGQWSCCCFVVLLCCCGLGFILCSDLDPWCWFGGVVLLTGGYGKYVNSVRHATFSSITHRDLPVPGLICSSRVHQTICIFQLSGQREFQFNCLIFRPSLKENGRTLFWFIRNWL